MKARARMLAIMVSLFAVGIVLAGCELVPEVTAIKMENNGNDDMELIIDGLSNGYVMPGESKTVDVAPGVHLVQIRWATGRDACTPSSPSVEKGTTQIIRCSAHR